MQKCFKIFAFLDELDHFKQQKQGPPPQRKKEELMGIGNQLP